MNHNMFEKINFEEFYFQGNYSEKAKYFGEPACFNCKKKAVYIERENGTWCLMCERCKNNWEKGENKSV